MSPATLADQAKKSLLGMLQPVAARGRWLDEVDPGRHRRIKGLPLATAYGVAAKLGTLQDIARSVPSSVSLGYLARRAARGPRRSQRQTDRRRDRGALRRGIARRRGERIRATISNGLAEASRETASLSEPLLYRAKSLGGNRLEQTPTAAAGIAHCRTT